MTIKIHDTDQSDPGGRSGFTTPEFLDYAEQSHVIGDSNADVLYTTKDGTERFNGHRATPGTSEFLGVPPLRGRALQPDNYKPGAPRDARRPDDRSPLRMVEAVVRIAPRSAQTPLPLSIPTARLCDALCVSQFYRFANVRRKQFFRFHCAEDLRLIATTN